MAERVFQDTSRVQFPLIKVNGEWTRVLPMNHIITDEDKEKALDLIQEMKLREGQDFYKNGDHSKLERRGLNRSHRHR